MGTSLNSQNDQIIQVNIEEELKQSYLDYAMSVIVGRALPDVRDGLKPVHRRILYAMYEAGNDATKPYKKSARIVGEVMGKYHPHGDSAIYDSMVRMAQSFSMRYRLVDGQGNFGSVDGDPAAAMRYTEVRMAKITQVLLADIEKNTVNFYPNYDGSEMQPEVLPTKLPNLIINGTSGIAVGMATNIPPHNLSEVINACLLLLDDPETSLKDLMAVLPGPDFPTSGIIQGRDGIFKAYKTGRGRIYVRAKTEIEVDPKNNSKSRIIVTELPYQVNKAKLLEKIAELVKDKKIEGITGLRDESDKDGMRVVIETRRGDNPEVILNNLYTLTPLQSAFGINMVALVDNQPKLMSLSQILNYFIQHRHQVVSRRVAFELKQARARAHILEGLTVALANLDPIIALIKSSPNSQAAKEGLINTIWVAGEVMPILTRAKDAGVLDLELNHNSKVAFGLKENGSYKLSLKQAQAILDLKLNRLTGLEQNKLTQEFENLIKDIKRYLEILNSPSELKSVVRAELEEVRSQFGDQRRTVIIDDIHDLNIEDLITQEDLCITLSNQGYLKSQAVSDYQAQKRGGRGKAAIKIKDTDYITKLTIANSHDHLLCFSDFGRIYWLKVYQVPAGSRQARGRPIVNVLPLSNGEKVTTLLAVKDFNSEYSVFFATQNGIVKKVGLDLFSRPRSNGIIAIELDENDRLISAQIAKNNVDVMLCSDAGKAVRFNLGKLRSTGRSARGVRGMRLKDKEKLVSALVLDSEGSILSVTENGFGKQTNLEQYSQVNRGSQGVINIQTSERNGKVVGAVKVNPDDEIMLISDQGMLVRTTVAEIPSVSRNTQGVKLINLNTGENLVEVSKI